MEIQEYLSTTDDQARLNLLTSANERMIPFRLVEQLLCLPLPPNEKISLINCAWSQNQFEWEKVLIRGLQKWDQNLSAHALRCWAETTGHICLPIIENILTNAQISQRVFYTFIDSVAPVLGLPFIARASLHPGINDYSPTFHGLLMLRSMESCSKHPNIDELAKKYLINLSSRFTPDLKNAALDGKGQLEAAFWLIRHDPQFLEKLKFKEESWTSLIQFLLKPLIDTDWIKKTEKALKAKDLNAIRLAWPILPYRHLLDSSHISSLFNCMSESSAGLEFKMRLTAELIKGISVDILQEAVFASKPFLEKIHLYTSILQGPLCLLYDGAFRKKILPEISDTNHFHGRIALLFNPKLLTDYNWGLLDGALKQADLTSLNDIYIPDESPLNESAQVANVKLDGLDDPLRDSYFNLVFKLDSKSALPVLDSSSTNFWQLLIMAHGTKNPSLIEPLTHAGRKQPYLFRLSVIAALGKFENNDHAALKLLDHIRTQNSMELSEVINALGSINSSRCLQELVGCLTRPNITAPQQLEICRLLKDRDTSKIQSELKDAINDLSQMKHSEEAIIEIRELLVSMLQIVPNAGLNLLPKMSTTQDLDDLLKLRIDTFSELSSEIKRALRTAQFFHNTVKNSEQADLIELSPIIDMQYKALELLFREQFEDFVNQIISTGVIQRKLDIIGYSRPIPASMDEFENFLSSLPIVRDIPFFSRFKLRKLLRALAQYQPGKRFTLDGVKAFALFFLIFGRKDCPFGLNQLVKLGFGSDRELAMYSKSLHQFQDFRNRAAHEGFRPDDRQDIDAIWTSVAEIISVTRNLTVTSPILSNYKDRAAS